jgi:hypothetical protein
MLSAVLAVALSGATVASDSRCNDIHISAIQTELQNFAAHPAPAAAQNQRGVALVQAQSDIEEEQVVLEGVCPQDNYLPLAARISALDAWADLLVQRNVSAGNAVCPQAEVKVAAASAASAWLKLAVAAKTAPNPPKLVATLIPQVQTLAGQAGITLPAFADATSYWEQQYETAAKQAIVDCASRTPQP